jgi:hypothetical protein
MTAIATSAFRLENLTNFISNVSVDSYYMMIGRPKSWTNENSPDTPYDNYNSNYLSGWDDMLAAKRITGGDISYGIRRVDWTSGTVYAMYDDRVSPVNLTTDGYSNLFDSKFYVFTDDFNVYKCISNNGGATSSVKPTGMGATVLTTADGYKWKFIYSLTGPDFQKFATDNYLPVKYSTTAPAVSGKIDFISVDATGSGYTSPTVQIIGDGVGAVATLVIGGGGAITGVNISSGGSGYTRARCVITGANTTPATLRVIIPPMGGHGADPKAEFGAYFGLISTQFRYDESGKFPIVNDYRRIGIVVKPFLYGTNTQATATQLSACQKMILDVGVVGTFVPDEIITGGTSGKTGYVVSYDSVNRIVTFIQSVSEVIGAFTVGETVTGSTSSAIGVISTGGLVTSDLEYGSGSFIYIEQRRPINRALDQIEAVVLAIKF